MPRPEQKPPTEEKLYEEIKRDFEGARDEKEFLYKELARLYMRIYELEHGKVL
jgi:hypothetical protein